MKVLDFLQGKWLGHPLHPVLVHVPVGAWLTACALDVATQIGFSHFGFPRLSLYLVGAGLLVAVAAGPPGIADWIEIKKEKPARKIGLLHMVLNLAAAVVWAGNLLLRLRTLDAAEPVTRAILLTSIAGTLLLVAGAYLGMRMVFEHGIGIARQSKKKWRTIAEQGGARVPPAK